MFLQSLDSLLQAGARREPFQSFLNPRDLGPQASEFFAYLTNHDWFFAVQLKYGLGEKQVEVLVQSF
ncbi:MAG TPA: hypothetical protein VMH03_19750 [Terriglobales bacterium]|nr:hypothetical protein [Terriglobales bacterium]